MYLKHYLNVSEKNLTFLKYYFYIILNNYILILTSSSFLSEGYLLVIYLNIFSILIAQYYSTEVLNLFAHRIIFGITFNYFNIYV